MTSLELRPILNISTMHSSFGVSHGGDLHRLEVTGGVCLEWRGVAHPKCLAAKEPGQCEKIHLLPPAGSPSTIAIASSWARAVFGFRVEILSSSSGQKTRPAASASVLWSLDAS